MKVAEKEKTSRHRRIQAVRQIRGEGVGEIVGLELLNISLTIEVSQLRRAIAAVGEEGVRLVDDEKAVRRARLGEGSGDPLLRFAHHLLISSEARFVSGSRRIRFASCFAYSDLPLPETPSRRIPIRRGPILTIFSVMADRSGSAWTSEKSYLSAACGCTVPFPRRSCAFSRTARLAASTPPPERAATRLAFRTWRGVTRRSPARSSASDSLSGRTRSRPTAPRTSQSAVPLGMSRNSIEYVRRSKKWGSI